MSTVLYAPAFAADMAAAAIKTLQQSTVTTVQSPASVNVPALSQHALDGLYAVDKDKTPSGFAVPRFVSLKFGKVNARTGPSRNHSIAYQYQRRGLPLIVVAETEMWRKVRDMSGDEAWVRKPALSGEKFALLTAQAPLRTRPTTFAHTLAMIEAGALVHLEDCTDAAFCRIRTRNGIKGFTSKDLLWGAQTVD